LPRAAHYRRDRAAGEGSRAGHLPNRSAPRRFTGMLRCVRGVGCPRPAGHAEFPSFAFPAAVRRTGVDDENADPDVGQRPDRVVRHPPDRADRHHGSGNDPDPATELGAREHAEGTAEQNNRHNELDPATGVETVPGQGILEIVRHRPVVGPRPDRIEEPLDPSKTQHCPGEVTQPSPCCVDPSLSSMALDTAVQSDDGASSHAPRLRQAQHISRQRPIKDIPMPVRRRKFLAGRSPQIRSKGGMWIR
jgi:hypothetical protein